MQLTRSKTINGQMLSPLSGDHNFLEIMTESQFYTPLLEEN